jgi:hypothetical protein
LTLVKINADYDERKKITPAPKKYGTKKTIPIRKNQAKKYKKIEAEEKRYGTHRKRVGRIAEKRL